MSDYTIDTVKADIGALGKNVIKIRKYIRDHQSQLQQFSTNMLNQAVKGCIPAGMLLKRNYGVLSLRTAGAPAPRKAQESEEIEEEPVVRKVVKKKKQIVVEEEDESDDVYEPVQRTSRRPVRRPADVYEDEAPMDYQVPQYAMTNEDLAKMAFLESAQRKWRRFA